MIELRHLDVRHCVIIQCSHLANGCTNKCGWISFILFRYLSYVYMCAIICDTNTIGFVSEICMTLWSFGGKLSKRSPGIHEPKWTSHVKQESDVAQSYTSSDKTQLCKRSPGIHEPKWTSHVKQESDIAQSYTSSDKTLYMSHITRDLPAWGPIRWRPSRTTVWTGSSSL